MIIATMLYFAIRYYIERHKEKDMHEDTRGFLGIKLFVGIIFWIVFFGISIAVGIDQYHLSPKDRYGIVFTTKKPDPIDAIKENYDRAVMIGTSKIIHNDSDGRNYLDIHGKKISIVKVLMNKQCRNCDKLSGLTNKRDSTNVVYVYDAYEGSKRERIYSLGNDIYLSSLITKEEK